MDCGGLNLVGLAGLGAAFSPLILLALFWRRTNLAGAVLGMVTGAVTCFAWKFCPAEEFLKAHPGSILQLYELAPGFLFAFLPTVTVSLATKKPSAEITAEFDAVATSIKE